MADDVLKEIEDALDDLSGLLDDDTIRNALGLIPDTLLDPVVEGLKTVLNVISDALQELLDNLNEIVNLGDLFDTIDGLLAAVGDLAPGEKETLETVEKIVNTLKELPDAADIERIMGKVGQIIAKLENL